MNSIGTKIRAKANDVFAGMNRDNIFILWCLYAIKFTPIKTEKDRVKVINIWLVIVKL